MASNKKRLLPAVVGDLRSHASMLEWENWQWMSEAARNMEDAASLLESLDYENGEARSELARHHADFEAISNLCTEVVEGGLEPHDAINMIRNIVG